MKSNFIKYDGSSKSLELIGELIERANKKYDGVYRYSFGRIEKAKAGCLDHIWIQNFNAKRRFEEQDLTICVPINRYVYFEIPEDVPSYSSAFPSFNSCVESYYLEYKQLGL